MTVSETYQKEIRINELEEKLRDQEVFMRYYKSIVESEPHGSAIESLAHDIDVLKENQKMLIDIDERHCEEMQDYRDRIDTDFDTIKVLTERLKQADYRYDTKTLEEIGVSERLRKYEVLQYTPREIEVKLNMLTNLVVALERFDVLDVIESENEIDSYWVKEDETRDNFKEELDKMLKDVRSVN